MRIRWICLVFLTLGVEASAQTPKPPVPPKTFDIESIDAYIAGAVLEKKTTGLSVAIVRDSRIVFAKGYGLRSIAEQKPVEVDTAFAAGSVTKQFTCAAILMLAEMGKLSVDDKVAKYFPHLNRAGEITLYQLMTHTSGYPDYYPLDFVDRRLMKPLEVDRIITEYAGGPLDFEPGTRWSYSNTGYMILGRVIDKVRGVDSPYQKFVEQQILRPVGLWKSGFPNETQRYIMPLNIVENENLAEGYTPFALEPLKPAIPEAGPWLYGAGDLWATASDLARWDIALMEGRILKPESFRLMTTPVTLRDGRVRDYGCGLNVKRENSGYTLSHGGAVSGFRASNTLIPRTKSAVVVLINDEQAEPEIVQTIVGLIGKAENPVDVPKVAGASAKDAALEFFHQMQAGKLDRSKLGEEFSIYLTDERIQEAAPKLKALGEPTKVEAASPRERGGLEVSNIRLTFPSMTLGGLLYRSPDGKIEQLLFNKVD
jgi:CubicO group peptidase (beta-lactamase class C family)